MYAVRCQIYFSITFLRYIGYISNKIENITKKIIQILQY